MKEPSKEACVHAFNIWKHNGGMGLDNVAVEVQAAIDERLVELRRHLEDAGITILIEHGEGRISGLTLIHPESRESLAKFKGLLG